MKKPAKYVAIVDETGEMNGRTVLCSGPSQGDVEKEVLAMVKIGEVDPDVPVVIYQQHATVSVAYRAELVKK